jgi:hypothetical protein
MSTTIPREAYIAAFTEGKRVAIACGHRFRTIQEIEDTPFNPEDRLSAGVATVIAVWQLKQQFPDSQVGLEAYGGASGLDLPSPLDEDGERYSFDIALDGREGPSVDGLIGGVEPAYQPDDNTSDQQKAEWRRDWRPPIDPTTYIERHTQSDLEAIKQLVLTDELQVSLIGQPAGAEPAQAVARGVNARDFVQHIIETIRTSDIRGAQRVYAIRGNPYALAVKVKDMYRRMRIVIDPSGEAAVVAWMPEGTVAEADVFVPGDEQPGPDPDIPDIPTQPEPPPSDHEIVAAIVQALQSILNNQQTIIGTLHMLREGRTAADLRIELIAERTATIQTAIGNVAGSQGFDLTGEVDGRWLGKLPIRGTLSPRR